MTFARSRIANQYHRLAGQGLPYPSLQHDLCLHIQNHFFEIRHFLCQRIQFRQYILNIFK